MITDTSVLHAAISQMVERNPGELALSVIVPTRNEAGNVEMLLVSIEKACSGQPLEVIFVDDSTDNTPQVVERAALQFPGLNIRLIHRPIEGRVGGLGGAVVVGLRAAHAEYACVMDGDLQHPPELLPVLLNTAREKQADLVVATRRAVESKVTGLNITRNAISRSLDLVARGFFPRQLRGVSDPLTGFFLVRVKAIDLDALRPKGFKILLEILVRNPELRKAEVPFHFGERFSGQSKASASEAWKYLHLLWNMRFGESSLRFIGFAMVGLSGILVNSLALAFATEYLHIYYMISVALATVASTVWNFSLTEAFVYGAASQARGRLKRFGLFFIMNTIALSLRSPLIYVLTAVFGMYYLLSNLISLAALTILRFVLADNMIWGSPKTATAAVRSKTLIN